MKLLSLYTFFRPLVSSTLTGSRITFNTQVSTDGQRLKATRPQTSGLSSTSSTSSTNFWRYVRFHSAFRPPTISNGIVHQSSFFRIPTLKFPNSETLRFARLARNPDSSLLRIRSPTYLKLYGWDWELIS